MPVIATPIPVLTGGSVAIDLSVVTAEQTHVEGVPSYGRKQTARVNQGQYTLLRWQIRDRTNGRVVDLSSLATASSSSSSSASSSVGGLGFSRVAFRMREVIGLNNCLAWSAEARVVDPANGIVEATLPAAATALVGIYNIEFGLFDQQDRLVYSVQGYLWVNRGQFGDDSAGRGVPSIDDLRALLRDNGPEDNYLIAVTEFDTTEYVEAVVKSIVRFNMTPPAITRLRRDTTSYPDSSRLVDAILGELYLIGAAHYRRNHLSYQAAGVAVDDKNKASEYERIGTAMLDRFDKWASTIKRQANASAFGGTHLSPYSNAGPAQTSNWGW